MMLPNFDSLRAGGADCPSDIRIEALHAGELTDLERTRLLAHTTDCGSCAARLAEYRAGFDAQPGADPVRMLAAIRAAAPAARRGPDVRRRIGWALGLAFTVSLVVAVVPRDDAATPPQNVVTPAAATRTKGGLGLRVFRWKGDRAAETASGDAFRAGDRLRFVVDLPTHGQVNIIGVEPSGRHYVAWPVSSVPAETRLGPATQLPLDGAVRLDDTVGTETLYLVQCSGSEGPERCTTGGEVRVPTCPPQCAMTPFVLEKVR